MQQLGAIPGGVSATNRSSSHRQGSTRPWPLDPRGRSRVLDAQECGHRRIRVDRSRGSPAVEQLNERLDVAGPATHLGHPADSLNEGEALVVGKLRCPAGHLKGA